MKSLVKILKYIKPYQGYAILSVSSNLIQVVLHLLSILAFLPLLSLLFGDAEPVTVEPEFDLSSDYVEAFLTIK